VNWAPVEEVQLSWDCEASAQLTRDVVWRSREVNSISTIWSDT
jgi:hypothetical protein